MKPKNQPEKDSPKPRKKYYHNNRRNKSAWNANRIVSISAICISLFTLFILIYQSRLLSRQFEQAQKQQYASVLPYLEIGPSFGYDYFRVVLSNTGIGPAFIKEVFILYNDEKYEMDLFRFLEEYATPADSIGQYGYSSLYPGRVIQPGSFHELIWSDASSFDAGKLRDFFTTKDIVLVIEYASVYDERWILESTYPPIPIPKGEYVRTIK